MYMYNVFVATVVGLHWIGYDISSLEYLSEFVVFF
jgi:hypothetical protein